MKPMGSYSVDWSQMTRAQLEQHVADLKAVGKTPTAALLTALRTARRAEQANPALGPGEWIFTFGVGHVHPITGESLRGCYVRIPGDYEAARAEMLARFGQAWCWQEPGDWDGAENLREIALGGAA
jgi:hypothetical protein